MTFHEQLKLYMVVLSLNNTEIGKKCGATRVSVSKWLNGHSLPNPRSFIILIFMIAKRTGMNPVDLYDSMNIDSRETK